MCRAFGIGLGSEAWIAMTVVLVTLLTWIRNLDELAIMSSIANLCILFSLAVIVYEVIYQLAVQDPYDPSEKAAIRDGGIHYYRADISLALYFGAAIYSFEGIGVVGDYYSVQAGSVCVHVQYHLNKFEQIVIGL